MTLTVIPVSAFAADVSPTNVQPRATTFTWNLNNVKTSALSSPFALGSDQSFLTLTAIKQDKYSIFGSGPKVEYRLVKVNSNGTTTDTGIYDVVEGSYPTNSTGKTTDLYNVPKGTYKLKATVLNDVEFWSTGTIKYE